MKEMMRAGAVCGVVLGLSLGVPGAVESVTGETAATSFVVGLGAAFGAPALTAMYLLQRREAGSFGGFAYLANVIGLGLFAGVAFSLNLVLFFLDVTTVPMPTKIAILSCAAVFVIGTILFGISMLRAKVFPKLPVIGYFTALPLLAVFASLPDTVLTSGLHVIGAASVIWLSVVVWRRAAVVSMP